MRSEEKLTQAYIICNERLSGILISIEMNFRLATIKIILKDGTTIFIRYNNHSEYSYSIIFSHSKYDRVRFDNFDDEWEVKTRPHHFHPINDKRGYESAMKGEPKGDLPIIFDLLRKKALRRPDLRF